jgi:hypothetical protein
MDLEQFVGSRRPRRQFRKCPSSLVERAWPHIWGPTVLPMLDAYRKFQWSPLKASLRTDQVLAPHASKLCAAILYMFACWSAANPGTPLYPIVRGATTTADQANLLATLRAAPRLTTKSCRFVWKTKATTTPPSLAGFGAWGEACWKIELREAETRALARIASREQE